jgi:Fe-S-cluster-containing dehydrogenase component
MGWKHSSSSKNKEKTFQKRKWEALSEESDTIMTVEYPKCLGCGYCCKQVQCAVSFMQFGAQDECPALRFHDGRHWCGIIEDASEGENVQYIAALCIGAGCTSNLNSERQKYAASQAKKAKKS